MARTTARTAHTITIVAKLNPVERVETGMTPGSPARD